MSVLSRSIAFCITAVFATAVVAAPESFVVTSPGFAAGEPISNNYIYNDGGCHGADRSPALDWRNAPPGTKSFAVTLFDLDEPGSPSGWWHWVIYDLPGSTTGLIENAGAETGSHLPHGTRRGRTDQGTGAYHGPCPGQGEPAHRYQITIYALAIKKLPVPTEPSGSMVAWTASTNGYTLAKATLTATYGR